MAKTPKGHAVKRFGPHHMGNRQAHRMTGARMRGRRGIRK